MAERADLDRRRLLGTLAAGALAMLAPGHAHGEPGVIPYHGGRISPPVPMPALPLQLADGTSTDLATLLRGRATALHLMFTGCTTTCPIQGVVFSRVQGLLRDAATRRVQLLSLSINPLEDTPAAMRAWLARFAAGPGWIAARTAPEGLDAIARLFGAGSGSLADHATSVSLINTRAMLVWRTYDLPSPESLADMLNRA
ncbi:MAG TPA: SCO family protein [Burkholderiaceae bacterium]